MQELIQSLPAISGIVEKGGIIGVLLIVCFILGWALVKLRAETIAAHQQREREVSEISKERDKWKTMFVLCRVTCTNAGVKLDLSLTE